MIYQYDPDTLLGGVSTQVPAILSKYLSYRPKMAKHYKVEVDIKNLRTTIRKGTFWSGSWGRYHSTLELRVIARRPDSTVVMQRVFTYEEEQRRNDYDGRGPSKERDRARMYDLVETMLRKSAEDIGWSIRQMDARRWQAPAPQSIPTRLNRPPVDRVSGTPDADSLPAILGPLPVSGTAPAQPRFIVPSAPATPVDMWIQTPDGGAAVPMDDGLVPNSEPAPELLPVEEGTVI